MGILIKKWIWKVNIFNLSIFLDINMQMDHFMKGNGRMTFKMVKGSCIMPTKKNSKENVK